MQVVKGTIRDTRQKVSNLVENNEYQFRVCAVNKAGAGNYSEASDLYRAYDPIGTLIPHAFRHSWINFFFFFRIHFYVFALLSFLDLPGEPSKLRVVDSTKSSITLGWEKPIYDGGSEITHYVLDQMNTEEREWVTINPQVTTCEYVVPHLKPGTYYFFKVSAVNCKGKGEDIKMYQPVQAKDILGL